MSATAISAIAVPDSVQSIERGVRIKTWGRIHFLQVELVEGRIVVQGQVHSYYEKQLAIQAVLEATRNDPVTPVVMDIRVNDVRPIERA